MAVASAIMARARRIIQDERSVRWPLSELCDWLNDGLREMRIHKPALFSHHVTLALAAGTRQELPPQYERILRVIGNARTAQSDRRPRVTVTVVDQALLSATKPDWHDEDARLRKQQAKHFMFDETDPRAFYVYPANDGTGALSAVVVQPHTPIAATGSPDNIASYGATVPVEDVYANALVDYLLYRCYAKDAQFSPNMERAALYFSAFGRAIGLQLAQDANSSPNVRAGVSKSAPGVAADA